MPELTQPLDSLREFGRKALIEVTTEDTIGAPAGEIDEGDGAVTILFETTLPGYPGWRWAATVAQVDGGEPTLLETQLIPGEGALLAPDWIPWSERMEEYRAAQLALGEDAEAAATDETDDESDDDDDDDIDDDDEVDFDGPVLHSGDLDGVDIDEVDLDEVDSSAVPAVGIEQADEPEAESGGTGEKPPRAPRARKRTGKQQQNDESD